MKKLLFSLSIVFASCNADSDLDKNALVKGQTISKDEIIVYNTNSDLTKGEGFHCNYDIFFRISDKGIQFEPTVWNSKMVYAYGTVKNKRNIDNGLFYDFKGHFMRSSEPNATITKDYDCYLTAEIDTINRVCNMTVLLDNDSLIFELKYKK